MSVLKGFQGALKYVYKGSLWGAFVFALASFQLAYLLLGDYLKSNSPRDWIFKEGGVVLVSVGLVGSILIDFGFFPESNNIRKGIYSFVFGLGLVFIVFEVMFYLIVDGLNQNGQSENMNEEFLYYATIGSLIFSILFTVGLKSYLFLKEKV